MHRQGTRNTGLSIDIFGFDSDVRIGLLSNTEKALALLVMKEIVI
jgi:hypothetical protein